VVPDNIGFEDASQVELPRAAQRAALDALKE
jgi:hypothetical protein